MIDEESGRKKAEELLNSYPRMGIENVPLIESSPTKFMKSEEMSAYRYVLTHCYEQEVPQVNRILVEAGYKPLTSLVEGYGEDGVKLEA